MTTPGLFARSLWEAVGPQLGRRVCLHGTNGHHTGVIRRLLVLADGSGEVEFEDSTSVTIPPLRTGERGS